MPTGYTADVATGKVATFPEFAWLCARNFGALISLRDEPITATKPQSFEVGAYHADALKKAQTYLKLLEQMTPDEAAEAHRQACAENQASNDRINSDRAVQKARYEAMLASVRAWEPPTIEHVGLKEFMEKQLVESIDLDCQPVGKYYPDIPDFANWLKGEMRKALRDCEYHAAEMEKDRLRTEGRNAWVEALDRSLAARDKESQP